MNSQMKRVITALVIATAAATPASAQSILVHGGAVFASVASDDEDFDPGERTGPQIGAAAIFPITPDLGLRLDGNFVQKGLKIDEVEDGVSLSADIALSYVETGIYLTGGRDPFEIFAGPWVGFRAGCDVTGRVGNTTVSSDCSDLSDFKEMDFGVALGIRAWLDVRYLRLGAEVNVSRGLLDIADDDSSTDHHDLAGVRMFVELPISR